jgi:hypothetical protein
MPDRPVRLTFPSYDTGAAWIVADGVRVGHVLADDKWDWRARLWLVAEKPGEGFAGEVVGGKLAATRVLVRAELAERGPWWKDAARTEVA